MKTALFLDFDDSFSYNVVQELEQIGFKVQVLTWKKFSGDEVVDLLVLGPGPGHPDEYDKIFGKVHSWLAKKRPFLGICLGHQIFWRLQGARIERSKCPVHGRKVKLELTPEWKSFLKLKENPWVQRYNSLCVPSSSENNLEEFENFIQDQEIVMTRSQHVLTYQFHPESIGTSYREAFFRPLLEEIV